jgi:hypothetical protein
LPFLGTSLVSKVGTDWAPGDRMQVKSCMYLSLQKAAPFFHRSGNRDRAVRVRKRRYWSLCAAKRIPHAFNPDSGKLHLPSYYLGDHLPATPMIAVA